jgi:hypothetical protein
MRKPIKFGVGQLLRLRYKTEVINADGSVAKSNPWKNNLVLDQWLNGLALRDWLASIDYIVVGTGTGPTKRDSGAITFTQAANTVTASAGFFQLADEGRLFRRDTGEEVYVTHFTDTQHVDVSGAPAALGAAEGTIWYVSDIGLGTEVTRFNTRTTGVGEDGATLIGNVLTHHATYLSGPFGAPKLLREIGWSHSAVAGNNINGRDVIAGGGDSVGAGQQYKVELQLDVTYTPDAPTAVVDVGNNGFDSSGNAVVEVVNSNTVDVMQTNGFGTGNGGLDTNTQPGVRLIDADFVLQSISSVDPAMPGTLINARMDPVGYTTGNFYQDFSVIFPVNSGDKTIYGMTFSTWVGFVAARGFSLKFTTPQTWVNGHTLGIVFRKSWGRILVN